MNKEQTIAYFNGQIVRMEEFIATMSGDGELKLRLQRSLNAYKMAIKALEQQPCEDCISRQAVDDAIYDYSRSCDVNYEQIMEFIDKLPSVTPQPKKGKWVNVSPISYICSCCSYGVGRWNNTSYCPNCGAEMGGADETN